MKKIILFMTALMMTVCMQAQILHEAPQGIVPKSVTSTGVKKTITPKDGQMWWGYYADGETVKYLGTGWAETFDCAMYVPAGHDLVGSNSIKAIRFYVSAVSSMTMAKIWVSSSLPSNVDNADYVQTIEVSSLSNGVNDITLDTPFAVNDRAIYVGYSFTIRNVAYGIGVGGDYVDNSLFLRSSQSIPEWGAVTNGKLALQILLDGGNYPSNCARAADFGRTVVMQGGKATVPITVTNTGMGAVSEITYTMTTDGGVPTEEQTVDVGSLALNESKSFNVMLDGADEARKYVKTLTITKVNGVDNTAKKNTATGHLIGINEKPAVVPVVEEFTGTWCGYCPYGIVGMQKAHEAYGDNVALIAVHDGDVMDIGVYGEVLSAYVNGYPSSRINRGPSSIYPSSSLVYYLKSYFDIATQGSIGLIARWADSEKTAVRFSTTSKFYYDAIEEQYGIAFVLVEDGLTGYGSSWAQRNFLSGESGSGEMSFWYKAGEYVSGLEYDHVAVAAWDAMNGVNGSVNPTIQSGVEQKFSFSGDISSNSHIQDKSKLKAIALLIDRANGRIVNAAQATIAESVPVVKGDADGSGFIDDEDVFALVSYLLGDNPNGISSKAADLTGDGKVDIADLVQLISIVTSM